MITEISNYMVASPGVLVAFILWEVFWKGLGLWRAGRKNQPLWFVSILILNTVGILPIVYLLISKEKSPVKKKVIVKKKKK